MDQKDKDEILQGLGEILHTNWRKGVDCAQAVKIWDHITDMDNNDWGCYLNSVFDTLVMFGWKPPEKPESEGELIIATSKKNTKES